MLKKILVTSSLATLALVAGAAHAGGYVGASVGHSEFPDDFDNSISFSVKGGYKFSENFAFEAAYLNLGKADDGISPVWEAEVTGINTSVVGIAPINQNLEVFAKVGTFFWSVDLSEEGYGKIAEDDGTDIGFGFGGAYHITDDISVFAEYQRFDVDDGDIDNFSVGTNLYF
ncbi:outer membrane beta-barrel protein (plasmid) [Halomonas sp. Bachu 37]|uniref:outer membrane beta-barrel protein n=1 Tax=Halomonas kashgarensis TaxID=3084920 RepID=UPI00321733EB